jgi:prepilin-type N-terminal cleavage/methylation domain-containing protein
MPEAGRTSRGFTLIELMVTVAVMVILAAIAAPSMTELINNGAPPARPKSSWPRCNWPGRKRFVAMRG